MVAIIIMLLRSHKPSQKIHEFVLDPSQFTPCRSPNPISRRSSQTAKSKSRVNTPGANKTISIKPESHNSNFSYSHKMNHSSEMLPKEERSFVNVAPPVMQFDHLQLQDFLKLVIINDKKSNEDRSEEIIRSLNGTWFRNTQSNQKAAYRLFNSLGIKRTRVQSRHKQFSSIISGDDPSDILRRQYSPPNKFPAKKYSSKKCNFSKLELSSFAHPQKYHEESPLKARIMRRLPQSQSKINSSFKRSFSYLQKKKNQLQFDQGKQKQEGLIKGRRMILYKD